MNIKASYDVIVVGGGIAGVAAAVSARRVWLFADTPKGAKANTVL